MSVNVLRLVSTASEETGGIDSGPVHTCRAGPSIWWIWNLCSLSLYLSVSHTLFSQRCCAVSHNGKVPFPSISGRLQRSIIREINGTGPISCLVPFESAKLLRTSKKMSQFIWDLLSFLCKCQTHTTKPMLFTHISHSCTFMHTHTHTYTLKGTSFLAQEKQLKCDIRHGKNGFSVNGTMVWMVN